MVVLNGKLALPNYPVEAVGIPGEKGEDGKTSYVHIAYSNSADGHTDFSTTDPTGKAYLGTYTDFELLDSNNPDDYTWSKTEGEQGEQGDKGENGEDGKNGLDSDGQLIFNNMFLDYPITGGTDINRETRGWSYASSNLKEMLEGESDAPTYRIMRVGGTTSTTKYLYTKNIPVTAGTRVTVKGQVRSNYDASSSTFSAIVLQFFTLSSNPADNSQASSMNGNTWVNARTNGTLQIGAGIGTGNATLQMTPMKANEWSDFSIDLLVPEGVAFMKVLNYNSNSDATTMHDFRRETAIAYQQGEKGIAGEKGEDGRTSYVHIAYANDANGTGFSFNPTNKDYTGMYTDFTETSSTEPRKYNWQLTKGIKGDQGIAGQAGEDGRTPYFHTAWANSSDGTFEFSTTDSTNRAYLGTYTDFEINDSTDPSKYNWIELVGALVVDSVNYALESRYDNLSVSGASGGNYRRKQFILSKTLKKDSKVQFSFDWSNRSGSNPTKIRVVMWGASQASSVVDFDTTGANGHCEGSMQLTNDATHIYIYMNGYNVASTNELQIEYLVVNRGDKLSGWLPNPADKVELNNMMFNSTMNLEFNGWTYSTRYEILAPDPDKPNSHILHGIPNTATTQQLGTFPYIPVKKGMLVHVSFDYSENKLGNDPTNVIFAVRNLPTGDINQSSANSQEQWYYRRSDMPTQNIVNVFTRFDFYCKVTLDGFLCIIPSDSSNTGTHHSYYREIMVTAGGSLQGDWSPAYSDSQFQLDQNKEETSAIPRIYTQSTTPTENVKNGDTWFKMSNNIVLGVYVYGNGQWNEQAYDSNVIATNIIGKTITGSELNGNTINGTVITGSEFTNIFTNVTSGLNVVADGQTTIKDGSMSAGATYYLTDSSGNRLYKFANNESYLTKGSLEVRQQLFDEDEIQTSSSTAGLSGGLLQLNLQDSTGSYNGTLDAKLLESISSVKTTTVNVPATSNYEANSFTLRRFGQMVVVNFNFKTITNNGWVVLATIPQGYRPIALQMAETVVTSTTYRGNFATIYTNGSYQFAYLPSVWASGVTSDTYHGSMTYFTNDAWGLA